MKTLQCVLEMLIDASSATPDERAAAREVVATEFGKTAGEFAERKAPVKKTGK